MCCVINCLLALALVSCCISFVEGIPKNGSWIVLNESAYIMEDFDIAFTRPVQDRIVGRAKYTVFKNDTVILIIAKDKGKNFSCFQGTEIPSTPCPGDDYSVNETYISFKLRNVTSQDAGPYLVKKYLSGIHNTTWEEINFHVLEKFESAKVTTIVETGSGLTEPVSSGEQNPTKETKITTSIGSGSKGPAVKGITNRAVIIGATSAAIIVFILIGFVWCCHSHYKNKGSVAVEMRQK